MVEADLVDIYKVLLSYINIVSKLRGDRIIAQIFLVSDRNVKQNLGQKKINLVDTRYLK
ncbi:MAG: hypothetical protein SWX82_29010 [Cyanobacteriota bacterium]|nr:hypothetical protein [Cyanobacteriota bacterium]